MKDKERNKVVNNIWGKEWGKSGKIRKDKERNRAINNIWGKEWG